VKCDDPQLSVHRTFSSNNVRITITIMLFSLLVFVVLCIRAKHTIVTSPSVLLLLCEPGSSGSIVSGYGLDDRTTEVRSPVEAKDFSSNLCVQTGSGAHPASCTMGTEDPFPGGKARPGRDADHSPPSSAETVNE
jgi:hypothetical protein